MPRRRLKSKTRRITPADLSTADWLFLMFGHVYPRYRESDPTHGSQLDQAKAKRLIEDHQDELLDHLARPGSRPWVWWSYVATRPRCADRPEIERLAELGVLTEDERAAYDEIHARQQQRLTLTGRVAVAADDTP